MNFQKLKIALEGSFNIRKVKGGYEMFPKSDEFLTIDIYYDFIKFGDVRVLSPEFPWMNIQHKQVGDYECLVPGPESEILLHVSQILFQNRFLTLSDFFHLTMVMSTHEKTIQWRDVLLEASRRGWKVDLVKLISIVHGIHVHVWKKALEIPIPPDENVKISLPRFLNPKPLLPFRLSQQRSIGLWPFLFRDCWYYIYSLIKYHTKSKIPIYRDWINLSE